MATCPYCKGHLTDGHRCPGKLRRYFVVVEIFASAIAGAVVGLLILSAFDPFNQAADKDYATAIILGILAGIGINRLIRS
jgi:hypothetical protein